MQIHLLHAAGVTVRPFRVNRTPAPASARACVALTLHYRTEADLRDKRNPTPLIRGDGAYLLRKAERQYFAPLPQEPPRRTRLEPKAGPTVGSTSGLSMSEFG